MRKGWFKIPGQDGDRTPEEQIVAVRPALGEARGKTVLDLGSAEGLIAREFALAGALRVHCMESVEGHIEAGLKVCAGLPVKFTHINLNDAGEALERYDIVLALGILHKLHHPEQGLRYACASSAGLVLLRSGRGEAHGIIRSKYRQHIIVDAPKVFGELGFVLEKTVEGSRKFLEDVQYWRRA